MQSRVTDPLDISLPRPRRKTLRLGMMHHHLRPGGVTSVMRDMAIALGRHSGYETLEIDVFAAARSEARALKIFERARGDTPVRLRIVNIPSLAYRTQPYSSRSSFTEAADKLAMDILGQIDLGSSTRDCPYVLHSHNISLGKNPTATMAFGRIAEIAVERSLPLWLINHVHDFAENNRTEQMRAFNNCTGTRDEAFARSFMYPNTPNVVYLTINSADIETLLKVGISADRVFLLPDPIDVSQYEQGPLWEATERQLAAMGLGPGDYRKTMLRALADWAASRNQVFDDSLPILLSPLKVMRRKNNVESLLLLMLLRHLGRRFQMLISLGANSPPDIAYSRSLKHFAASRRLPVVIGFGSEIISEAARRRTRSGIVKRYNLCDLYALCSAVVTTSVVEGFGLSYHEGWLGRKPVIGRRIDEIVRDFEARGMSFGHLYEKVAVSTTDLPGLRERLREAYKQKAARLHGGRNRFGKLKHSPPNDIIASKLFHVGGQECVDFADLSVGMQLELLDRLGDEPALASRMIDRNPALRAAFRLLDAPDSESLKTLIETNREAVRANYSLIAMARRLRNLFEAGDSLYKTDCERVSLTPENHAAMSRRYRAPENVRLIF
jgi:glycosyltransferase involved in cell wall biosynthesis